MRFAGTRIEGLLGDRPDYGQTVSDASTLRSKESQAVTDAMADTASAGILGAGKAESAKITGAAEAALANAQGQASMMSSLGQIGGAAIGGFGNFNNTGSTGGFGNTFNSSSTSKFGDSVSNPMDSFRAAGIAGTTYGARRGGTKGGLLGGLASTGVGMLAGNLLEDERRRRNALENQIDTID